MITMASAGTIRHARWQRLEALHGATNMLHWLMCLVRYQAADGMVVAFDVEFVAFCNIVDNRVAKKLINTLSINQIN